MFNKAIFIFFTPLLAYSADFKNWEASTFSKIEDRIGQIEETFGQDPGEVRTLFAEALFDLIDELELFSFDFGDSTLKTGVERNVFKNNDLANTASVVDIIYLKGTIPLVTAMVKEIGESGGFSFNIGAKLGIQIQNIRQVFPPGVEKNGINLPYANDPVIESVELRDASVKSFEKNVALLDRDQQISGNEDEPIVISVLNQNGKEEEIFLKRDLLGKAQFGDFWNRFNFPLRIPVNSNGVLEKLANKEVISFLLDGSLEVGPNLIFSEGITTVEAGYKVFLKGLFRFTIYKEDSRYVRLKLTYERSHGRGVDVDVSADLFSGFFLFTHSSFGLDLNVSFFDLDWTKSKTKHRSWVYRYDLSTDPAKEALDNGLWGNFAPSEQLAIDTQRDRWRTIDEFGVEKRGLFKRGHRDETGFKVDLAFLNKTKRKKTRQDEEVRIDYPNGEFKIFSSYLGAGEWGWSNLWYNKEHTSYQFPIVVSDGKFSMDVIYQARDTSTTKSELRENVTEIGDLVGQPNLLPYHHVDGDSLNLSLFDFIPQSNLADSDYYVRMRLSQAQLQRFVDLSRDEKAMWKHLDKAFEGVTARGTMIHGFTRTFDQYVVSYPIRVVDYLFNFFGGNYRRGWAIEKAQELHKYWSKLKKYSDQPKKIALTMSKMFADQRFGKELSRLVRSVLADDQVAYVVDVNLPGFGRIYESGNTTLVSENVATEEEREFQFDRVASSSPVHDVFADIEQFKVSVIPGSESNDGQPWIHVDFSIRDFPFQDRRRALFSIELLELKKKKKKYIEEKIADRFIVRPRKEIVHNGANHIEIPLFVPQEGNPLSDLARAIKKDGLYRVRMRFSRDLDRSTGSSVSSDFEIKDYLPYLRTFENEFWGLEREDTDTIGYDD